ncbi:MAG TPA: S8 family serine peptidase, partial [Candidatus Dormibacteraeota bacterium]|nr:S8 family serine peptidase [Candidatus Dormibacteraeota bacterium]
QDGPIAQAVNDVCAAGTLFFSAAGNSGSVDHGTAGTWEGDFKDGGPATVGRGGRVHDFGGATYNTVKAGGGIRRVDFFWADPLGHSTNDYDVYILDGTGAVVRSSTNPQNGTQDPYEQIPFLNVGESIVIVKHSGADRYMYLSSGRGYLTYNTPGNTRGHNATRTPNSFTVGATPVSSPPTVFTGGSANPVETFSSDGPRRMFFNPDGSAITPDNFSSTGGIVVPKPDLTAADGVSSSVPGLNPFYGTSAAAPHAAAIAALLWSYSPFLTPAAMRTVLNGTALDIEGAGWDRTSGAGIVMAYPALAAAPNLVIQNIQMLDANTNGVLDANECAAFEITLQNNATNRGLTSVNALLTSSTPGVLVDPGLRSYPDLAPQASASSAIAFAISSTPSFVCGTNPDFTLQ